LSKRARHRHDAARLARRGSDEFAAVWPAGLLLEHGSDRVTFDGGRHAEPQGPLGAWLVTDARSECIHDIRALALPHQLEPQVGDYSHRGLTIQPLAVVRTSHPTFG
jgi:hypothetical protein